MGRGCARVINECRMNVVHEIVLEYPSHLDNPRLDRSGTANVDDEGEGEGEMGEMERKALRPLAAVRPMPAWHQCLGDLCWNWKYDLPLM